MSKKIPIKWGVFLCILCIGFFFMYKKISITEEVEYVKISQEDYKIDLLASGIVTAKDYVMLTAKVTGQIVSLPVKEGQKVQKGQLLCTIDSSNVDRNVKDKEAELGEYAANYAGIETSKELLEGKIEKLDLEIEKIDKDLLKKEELYQNGVIAEVEVDQVREEKQLKEADRKLAKIELASYEEGGSEVKKIEEKLKQAQVHLSTAKSVLSDYRISSPVSGIVTKISQKEGEITNANTSLMQIAKEGKKVVEIYVDERNIEDIYVGQGVTIYKSEDRKNTMPSKIEYISPKVEKEKGTVKVRCMLEKDRADKLLYDSEVTVSFLVKEYKDSKVLPSKFIRTEEGKKYVYVYNKGKAEKKEIETEGFGERVRVISDIKVDTPILFPNDIKNKQKVMLKKKVG